MKKQVITHFFEENPNSIDHNVAAGYAIGQHWKNTLTGREFTHISDGVWKDILAEGYSGNALGPYSHSEGVDTWAGSYASHAEGLQSMTGLLGFRVKTIAYDVTPKTGTILGGGGSITGDSTSFVTELVVGDKICSINGEYIGTVTNIIDNEHLTYDSEIGETNENGDINISVPGGVDFGVAANDTIKLVLFSDYSKCLTDAYIGYTLYMPSLLGGEGSTNRIPVTDAYSTILTASTAEILDISTLDDNTYNAAGPNYVYDYNSYVGTKFNSESDGAGDSSPFIQLKQVSISGNNIPKPGTWIYLQNELNIAQHVEGYSNLAGGLASHVEGIYNLSNGDYSHSEGVYSKADGKASHAEGQKTYANADNSHAEGQETKTFGTASHAEGNNTIAYGGDSHAEGNNTKAIDNASHAEGDRTVATGSGSHAEGIETRTYSSGAHAEGQSTIANGEASHAEGYETIAYNGQSHAEGNMTVAVGTASHAEGNQTMAYSQNSHVEGNKSLAGVRVYPILGYTDNGTTVDIFVDADEFDWNNTTIVIRDHIAYSKDLWETDDKSLINSTVIQTGGIYDNLLKINIDIPYNYTLGNLSDKIDVGNYIHILNDSAAGRHYSPHAEGYNTSASGEGAHSEGYKTLATRRGAHSEGVANIASGEGSHAEGYNTIASGYISHAEGHNTIASGEYSHAEGNNSIASGESSHAEGEISLASGYISHAEGEHTQATNIAAHAEGGNTIASGEYSHAEGYLTTASATNSHAEGQGSIASGLAAHAEGSGTIASGMNSHAGGYGTIATDENMTAIGRYNLPGNDHTLFVIGNGTNNSNRSNAFKVYTDGSSEIKNNLTVHNNVIFDNLLTISDINDVESIIIKDISGNLEELLPEDIRNVAVFKDLIPTGYKITNLINSGVSLALPPTGAFYFANDGLKLYLTQGSPYSIHQADLTNAFDLTTVGAFTLGFTYPDNRGCRGIWASDDGIHLYTVGYSYYAGSFTHRLRKFTMGTPFDLTTIVSAGSIITNSLIGLIVKPDGSSAYSLQKDTYEIVQYNWTTPFGITVSSSSTAALPNSGGAIKGLVFKPDGSKFYYKEYIDVGDVVMRELQLNVNWDISGGFEVLNTIASNDTGGMQFNSNGTSLFTNTTNYLTEFYSTDYELGTLEGNVKTDSNGKMIISGGTFTATTTGDTSVELLDKNGQSISRLINVTSPNVSPYIIKFDAMYDGDDSGYLVNAYCSSNKGVIKVGQLDSDNCSLSSVEAQGIWYDPIEQKMYAKGAIGETRYWKISVIESLII